MRKVAMRRPGDGKVVQAEVVRAATKEDGYGRGFRVVRYETFWGAKAEAIVHRSLLMPARKAS